MPTFRNLIEAYRDDMEPFRRTMRDQYRPAFDRLWEQARLLPGTIREDGRSR